MASDDKEDSVWIRTEPSVDGKTFMVTVEFTEDRSITLDRQGAFEYAHAILTAVQYAEYDAAVYQQMKSRIPDEQTAMQLVVDMRAERPEPDFSNYAPFALAPGVSMWSGKAFLRVMLDGKTAGQWELDAAREHAMMAIEALIVADLDNAYLKILKGLVGLEDEKARQVVADLVRFR